MRPCAARLKKRGQLLTLTQSYFLKEMRHWFRLLGGFLHRSLYSGLVGLALVGSPPVASSQVEQIQYDFNMPSEEITAALRTLGSVTGLQFVRFSEPAEASVAVNAVVGRYTVDRALDLLLKGTGLQYRYVNSRTIAIVKARPPDDDRTQGGRSDASPVVPNTNKGSGETMNKRTGLLARVLGIFAVCASALDAGHACAQDASAHSQDAASAQLEEVVVTAEKRSEVLSKAAIPITVVSQETMDRQGITSLQDLEGTVPGLQTSAQGFSIRGIGANNYTDQTYSTVPVLIDGIYERRPQELGLGMYDIARIEVVRGPQGTVYGKNATAGVVNILSADPVQEFAAAGDVAYGNYNDLTARALVNIPLTDSLAVRASAERRRNDGYDASAGPRRYGIIDELSTRFTALWRPSDRFQWRLSASYGRNQGTDPYTKVVDYFYYPNANLATGSFGNRVTVPARANILEQPGSQDNSLNDHETAIRSKMLWDITDQLSVTYLGGYSWFKNGDATPSLPTFNFQNDTNTHAFSQELNVNYNTERVKAVAGAYYYHDKIDGDALIHGQDVAPSPFNLPYNFIGPIFQGAGTEPSSDALADILAHSEGTYSESRAVFGQLTYTLIDSLRLTGGVRYTKDDVHSDPSAEQLCAYGSATGISASLACGVPLGPQENFSALRERSSKVTWKGTVEYDVAMDKLLYATVATGYRGGGVADSTLPVQYQTFAPETVTNYEIGTRTLWLDRSLSVNLTGYYMQYNDLQVSSIVLSANGEPTPATANAARATIKGVDLEAAWKLTSRDTVSGFATFLDAKFTSFPNAPDSLDTPGFLYDALAPAFGLAALPTPRVSASGNQLPNAPHVTANLRYAHVFELANYGRLTPSVIANWQASSFSEINNVAQARLPSYSKTDVNVNYTDGKGRLSVDAFVYNIEDNRVLTSASADWAVVSGTYSAPRTYGIRIGYRY